MNDADAPPVALVMDHRPRFLQTSLSRTGSRELMLGWCLWLLASWGLALLLDSAVPAARWMIYSSLAGLMGAWPAFRLGQDVGAGAVGQTREAGEDEVDDGENAAPRAGVDPGQVGEARTAGGVGGQPARDADASHGFAAPLFVAARWRDLGVTLMDWFGLLLVFQAVLWPLRLVGHWSLEQALWLDATLAVWTLLTAAWIVFGRQFVLGWVRLLAMVLCVLLVMGEPAVLLLVEAPGRWTLHASPLQVLWELSATNSTIALYLGAVIAPLAWVGLAAGLAWLGLAVIALVPRRRVSR